MTPQQHSREPRINGPMVYGVRPGAPFAYTIAATGDRPMTFSARGLPAGLRLDPHTGRIAGSVSQPGQHAIDLQVENRHGVARRPFRIIAGDVIALTPPLGWNSWNCWGDSVDEQKIRDAADAIVSSGLIHHGWTYVNIDDGWQGRRGGPLNALQSNDKFPDMKRLCDYVHGLGLKIGIYSTPWVKSYAGFPGGSAGDPVGEINEEARRTGHYQGRHTFETADARQWAEWGIDYLKYDWNPNDVPAVTRMRDALRTCGRDIVYSLSNSAPFEHAAEWARLANCWRTTGDLLDAWTIPDSGFRGVADIGFAQDRWKDFAGPGHWNDPDMLVVGYLGWGRDMHPTKLTPDEQYTHVSLWCLLSAPLLLGCDLTRLDDFTLSLLTSEEVLAVNQDPLGRQAARVAAGHGVEVWSKDMEDGSKAVGLFNRDDAGPRSVAVEWSDLGVDGKQTVRDLWRRADVRLLAGRFEANVPAHGAALVRISPPE